MLMDGLQLFIIAGVTSVGWIVATLLVGAYVIFPMLSGLHAGDELSARADTGRRAQIIPFPTHRLKHA